MLGELMKTVQSRRKLVFRKAAHLRSRIGIEFAICRFDTSTATRVSVTTARCPGKEDER